MAETWTEWRLEKLRELWGVGKTASEIAVILGGGLTRNAVVGKAHRMGLAGRPSPIKRDAGTPKPPRPRRRPTPVDKIVITGPVCQVEVAPGIAFEVRREPTPPPPEPRVSKRTCCWPIGDPHEPGFHFCGATPVLEGRSYCEPHNAMAYRKTAPHASAAMPLFNGQTRKWAS